MAAPIPYVPGLAGVPATESYVSFVDGENGVLEYRGVPIQELCAKSHFVESAYLLINGRFPTTSELQDWENLWRSHRPVSSSTLACLQALPKDGHPMLALQALVAALGMEYLGKDEAHPQRNALATMRIMAKLPVLAAAFYRFRQGQAAVAPRADLGEAANFLWMMHGKEPSAIQAKIFDTVLLIHADHSLNASTFAGRVTASTNSDPYSVITAAIGTLKGPLHGGANEAVLRQLQKIGSVQNVRNFVQETVAKKEKIMGLGHRVYKVKDPRANALQALIPQLFKEHGVSPYYEIAMELEVVAKEYLGAKGIYPNVDLYSGIVYEKLGIPTDFFTPMFALGRTPGWLAHWHEQVKENRLFRPGDIYLGKHDQPFVPMGERSADPAAHQQWKSLLS